MRRLPVTLTGLAALAGCIFLLIYEPAFLSSVSRQASDVYFRSFSAPPASDAVIMLDIDEPSLAALGQWPWPRRVLARLVDRLWQEGASVVVFDIVFPERDRSSPAAALDDWRQAFGRDVKLGGVEAVEMDFDAELARALAGGRAVLGCYMELADEPLPVHDVKPDPLYRGHYFEAGTAQPMRLPQASAVISSISNLRAAATSEAFFNTLADIDNVIRRTPMLVACGPNRIYPSLGLEALRLHTGQDTFRIDWDVELGQGVQDIRLRGFDIPTDANGCLVLNFRSQPFPRASASDLLAGTTPTGAFSNRIVFVGTSAAGLRDIKATPLRPDVPGMDVHATAVDNILTGDVLREPRWAFHANLAGVLAFGLLLVWSVSRVRAWVGFLASLGCAAAACLVSGWLLARWRLVLSPAPTVLSVAVVYTLITLVKYWMEERERRRVRTMFGTMVSPDILDYMEDHPDSFSLVGRKVEATVLFSDIMGFTAIAENLDPDVLSRLMNRYLTPMSDIIMQREGYVDKFYGDAIMAVWGAPYALKDHALKACLAAVDQRNRLALLKRELQQEFGYDIRVRMGLNTGVVTAGNMGSERHFQYTVMGDAVNLAARLEQANKAFGTEIMIGEGTFDLVRDRVDARCLGSVRVRGKTHPVRVYELLALKGETEKGLREVVDLYEAALDCLPKGGWRACIEKLEAARRLKPDDGPTQLLLKRAQKLKDLPDRGADLFSLDI